VTKTLNAGAIALVLFMMPQMHSQQLNQRNGIQRVLLISIDGMHAIDFLNCAHGISTVNHGAPYCPSLAALGKNGINYVAARSWGVFADAMDVAGSNGADIPAAADAVNPGWQAKINRNAKPTLPAMHTRNRPGDASRRA
jgi:hypothetical protein